MSHGLCRAIGLSHCTVTVRDLQEERALHPPLLSPSKSLRVQVPNPVKSQAAREPGGAPEEVSLLNPSTGQTMSGRLIALCRLLFLQEQIRVPSSIHITPCLTSMHPTRSAAPPSGRARVAA